jgi:ppGpp synthetase/RelA/SpoT-type nucleotidyltranferase
MSLLELKRHLAPLSNALETELNTVGKNIPNGTQSELFSKKDFVDGLLSAQHVARSHLVQMFGQQSEWSKASAPLLEDFFTYEGNGDYSEGLFIGYYEAVGEGVVAAAQEVDKRFRDEVFMKGQRWSLPVKKREFYDYLRGVAQLLGTKKYPLDFWKSHLSERYVRVIAQWPPLKSEPHEPLLCMPHVKDKSVDWEKILPRCQDFWNTIYGGKIIEQQDEALRKAKYDLDAAKKEFEGINSQELKLPFEKYLQSADWKIDVDSINSFDLITLYHCYDAPYTVHVFSTVETLAEDGHAKSVVAVTRAQPSPVLSEEEREFFEKLSTAIGLLHDIEQTLAKKRESSVQLFWQLERVYLKEVPRYRRFIETLKLILSATCEAGGIEIQSIAGRDKEAESLFTKLCEWANDEKRDKTPSRAQWEKATRAVDMDFITRNMPDIAGVRVVCVYDSDVDGVREVINQLVLNKDLEIKKDWVPYKVYEDAEDGLLVKGYRAWHLDVSLGESRLNLVECRGLDGLVAEIQLKSAVGQAWSEAAHPIIYKPRLPEKVLRSADKLQHNMMNAAATLECADHTINAAKAAYDKLTGI